MDNPKLSIELVPKTSWYSNVRSNVSQKEWDIIRKKVYELAGNKCEICGGQGKKNTVECHEIWEYDDDTHIQKLKGFIALCHKCHQVKHIGLAIKKGFVQEVVDHLCKVNSWSIEQAKKYISSYWDIWKRRNKYKWEIEIDYIKDFIDNK